MEKTTRGAGIACSGYANCYVGCSCNTSNGWYSSCQGTDCKSVTDTRYTGVNAMSVSNVSDINSLTDGKSAQSTSGNSQVVSLSGGVSTMSSSGATTCYKKKTCEEGGYYSSVPTDKKCTPVKYNGYTCYTNCRDITYTVTISKVFGSSCPANFASGFNGISSCTLGSKSCATSQNSITFNDVAEGTSFKWTPQSSYSNNAATATTSDSFNTTITSNKTFTATYNCEEKSCACWPNISGYIDVNDSMWVTGTIECSNNGTPHAEICTDYTLTVSGCDRAATYTGRMCGGVGFLQSVEVDHRSGLNAAGQYCTFSGSASNYNTVGCTPY